MLHNTVSQHDAHTRDRPWITDQVVLSYTLHKADFNIESMGKTYRQPETTFSNPFNLLLITKYLHTWW